MKRIAAISLMLILLIIPLMAVNCGSDGDTTPPVTSDITVSCLRENEVTISWVTNEPATGNIEYGSDTSYGYVYPSPADTTTTTTYHSWTLSNLSPDTKYNFRIKSADNEGNEVISSHCQFSTSPTYATGVAWNSHNTPSNMEVGQSYPVSIVITNNSNLTWRVGGSNPVDLSYHWKIAGGDYVVWDGLATSLKTDVAPGKSTTVNATVTAPSPPGTYTLHWDMVFEGITWFSAAGCLTLNVPVQVTK